MSESLSDAGGKGGDYFKKMYEQVNE